MKVGVVGQLEITPPYCSAVELTKTGLMSEVEMMKAGRAMCR